MIKINEQYNCINTIVVFKFILHDTVVLFCVHILNMFIPVYDKTHQRYQHFLIKIVTI